MIPENSHRPNRIPHSLPAGLIPALAFALLCLWSSSAAADFRLCNNTSSRVGIALGYKDAEGCTTEGWANESSRRCGTPLRGTRARPAGRGGSGGVCSAASRGAGDQAMSGLGRIKIRATLGPASSDSAMIRRLFEAGADVFRINMSHTSHDKMRELVKTIRNVESSYGRPIGILVDLQGPKLRLGAFAEGAIQLNNGDSFVLDSDKTPGDKTRVQLPHPEILAALKPGHALLLDDGKVRLIVEEASSERAVTRVVIGGKMSDRKGVSLPDTDLPVSAMTPKDRADLEAALVTGVDWIALSFVQRAEGVTEAKKMIRGHPPVIAKIQQPQAIDRLGEIIDASDALMVARGDLGVELPLERVPSLQKQMTRMARRAGKPVVIATQMLESMIQAPVPTRAEVSDVATAIYEGAGAIMLSAEAAAGKIPVEAVSTMNPIGGAVQRDPTYPSAVPPPPPPPEQTVGDAIADAARQIAETLELSAIIC